MPPDRRAGTISHGYRTLMPSGTKGRRPGDGHPRSSLQQPETIDDERFLQEILGPPPSQTSPFPSSMSDIGLATPISNLSLDSMLSGGSGQSTMSISSLSAGGRSLMQAIPSYQHSAIKKRRRLLPEETELLVKVFDRCPRPNNDTRDQLSARLGMSPRAIQIWFQNRRAKAKRDKQDSGRSTLLFTPTKPGTESTMADSFDHFGCIVHASPLQRLDLEAHLKGIDDDLSANFFPDLFQVTELGLPNLQSLQQQSWDQISDSWYRDLSFLPDAPEVPLVDPMGKLVPTESKDTEGLLPGMDLIL